MSRLVADAHNRGAHGVIAVRVEMQPVADAELERRRQTWKLPEPRYTTGVLAEYARLVTGAERGAVTKP